MGKIPKAKIEFMRADGNGEPIKYFEIELDNVLIGQVRAFHQYHGAANFNLMRATKKYLSDMVGSRGCVRLREADAKVLFQWAPRSTEVNIS